jgi:Tfp pilus assembly protein PilZ
MEPNRRRYPRVRAQGLAAHLRSDRGGVQCVVENISLGGLFLRTDRLEEVGTNVSLLLVKPGWKKQLTLTARVTSRVDAIVGQARRVPGLGLQFTDVDGDCHERLRALLRQLGAPEAQPEVTLPDNSVEVELRALDPQPAAAKKPAPRPDGAEKKPAENIGQENARLRIQLRGLAMQLSDAQQLIVSRDAEIERLREQLELAKAALQRAISGR